MEASSSASRATRGLDATGEREVVFCHLCEIEWYRDNGGLVCPRCDGEAVEVVTADNDPRPSANRPPMEDQLRNLRGHDPWANGDVDDPEEEDISEYMPYDSRPSERPRATRAQSDSRAPTMHNFHSMVHEMVGPGFQPGAVGRSGPQDLFPRPAAGPGWQGGTFTTENGFTGATFTFSTGGGARDPSAPHVPQIDEFTSVLSSLFGNMPGAQPLPGQDRNTQGTPAGFAGLLASIMNPANAVSGDAVYSQEALDRIVSNLMEQHSTSNAPGPAPARDIAQLKKKKIDAEMLGPEGTAECSVCMDDVNKGDEVVVLPCAHWFHEQCARAWLSEHNTCPICRKGISSDAAPAAAAPASDNRRSIFSNNGRSMHSTSSTNANNGHPMPSDDGRPIYSDDGRSMFSSHGRSIYSNQVRSTYYNEAPSESNSPWSQSRPGTDGSSRSAAQRLMDQNRARLDRIRDTAGFDHVPSPHAEPEQYERPQRTYTSTSQSSTRVPEPTYGMPGSFESPFGSRQRSSGTGDPHEQDSGGLTGWLRRMGSGSDGGERRRD